MKAPALTGPLFALNSEGKKHRAPIETILWVDSLISTLKRELKEADQHEEQSGYTIESTMERVGKQEQVVIALYIKEYLENKN